jgi:hypothetical protein
MTTSIFAFGRLLPTYAVPVLNERAVRAAAGLLFLPAIVAFMNAWLLGNFVPTRVFVMVFLIDFAIRLFINPLLAPSMVLGQWMVRRQQPEWTGAAQKRFAWAIGFVLALSMFYLVVLKGAVGPMNLLVCATCLCLLFLESAFGICLGCWLYKLWKPEQAMLCPGDACEYSPDPAERVQTRQWLSFLVSVSAMLAGAAGLPASNSHGPIARGTATQPSAQPAATDASEQLRCKVPEFAKAMGHEEMWKLHNQCN